MMLHFSNVHQVVAPVERQLLHDWVHQNAVSRTKSVIYNCLVKLLPVHWW